MTSLALLREARNTSVTVAAVDHLLQLGYGLARAQRACRPYLDSVESAYGLLSLGDQEAAAHAASDAAVERGFEYSPGWSEVRQERPLAWAYLQIECARQIAELNLERAAPNEFASAAAEATLELLEFAVERARARWMRSNEVREYAFGGESLAGSRERGHVYAPSDVEDGLREWTEGGDWDQSEGTFWIQDHAWPIDPVTDETLVDERIDITVTFEPEEPACQNKTHDWQSPYTLLGGLKTNPGVRGKGGGIVYREVCAHCGTYRVTDTWAQDPSTGIQGLTSVAYEDADEDSLAWIAASSSSDESHAEETS